jgi:hypothetical protein
MSGFSIVEKPMLATGAAIEYAPTNAGTPSKMA